MCYYNSMIFDLSLIENECFLEGSCSLKKVSQNKTKEQLKDGSSSQMKNESWSAGPVVRSHPSLIYFTFRAGENITFKGSGWFTGRDYLPRQITSKYITFSLYTSQECWQDIHQAHLSNAIIAPSDASPPRNPASSSLRHAVPPFPRWWKRETGGRER